MSGILEEEEKSFHKRYVWRKWAGMCDLCSSNSSNNYMQQKKYFPHCCYSQLLFCFKDNDCYFMIMYFFMLMLRKPGKTKIWSGSQIWKEIFDCCHLLYKRIIIKQKENSYLSKSWWLKHTEFADSLMRSS